MPATTLIDRHSSASAGSAARDARSRWAFVGSSSLPADPAARWAERRGRRWLVLSYILCPCHLPLVLALIGTSLGGTALGADVGTNPWAVGGALAALWVLALWRGFRQIRTANALETSATGASSACKSGSCTLRAGTPPPGPVTPAAVLPPLA